MKYTILGITPWTEKTVPRVALLKENHSKFESKFFLFPSLHNMVHAEAVNDELTILKGYSVLLEAEDGTPLEDWTVGTQLIFPL